MGKFFNVGDRVRFIRLMITSGIYSNIKVGSVGTVKRVIGSNGWSVVFDGYPQFSLSLHADEIEKEDSNMNQFTKKNLKSGMLVVRRDGGHRLVHRTAQGQLFLATEGNGYLPLSDYTDDLIIINGESRGDIMSIYGRPNIITHYLLLSSNRTCIWERQTPVIPKPVIKEMTVEQISKALGCEVKIVK